MKERELRDNRFARIDEPPSRELARGGRLGADTVHLGVPHVFGFVGCAVPDPGAQSSPSGLPQRRGRELRAALASPSDT